MDIRIGNSPIAYAGNKNIKTNNKKEGCFSVNGNNQNQIKTSQNTGRQPCFSINDISVTRIGFFMQKQRYR